MWCDCGRSPRWTQTSVEDWGSLFGLCAVFEQSSAGCVNTCQWNDGWPGRGFRFQHIHNTPSVFTSHYCDVCPLKRKCIALLSAGLRTQTKARMLSRIYHECGPVIVEELRGVWIRGGSRGIGIRKGILCVWRRWPQLGRAERWRMTRSHTGAWVYTLLLMGVLLDLIRTAANAQPPPTPPLSGLTVCHPALPSFYLSCLRPFSIRHCAV